MAGASSRTTSAAIAAAVTAVAAVKDPGGPPLKAATGLRGHLAVLEKMALMLTSCGLFMLTGPVLILENKRIMQELAFSYPIVLSALGIVTSAVGTRVAVALGLATVRKECRSLWCSPDWYRCVLPVGACTAATLGFGNALYLHLGVGFAQMLKAFTPVVLLAVLVTLRLEVPTGPIIASVTLITLGTLVTTAAEPKWSAVGLCYTFLATLSEALRVALTQSLLCTHNFTVVEGQYVLAPAAACCLLLTALALELPRALAEEAHLIVVANPGAFVFAALLGAALNYLSYLVIQTTGALTLKVITTLRNVGFIVYGALLLGEFVSLEQGVGYSITLFGFVGYTHFSSKNQAAERLKRESTKQGA